MSIEITEHWSGKGWSATPQEWTAARLYDVSGTSDENTARAALAAYTSATSNGVYLNAPFKPNPYLRCNQLELAEVKGAEFMTFKANFKWGYFQVDPNPLALPPKIRWWKSTKWIETEHQVKKDGKPDVPILNTAGQIPKTKVTRPVNVRYLSIKRYEPFFNGAQAQQFEEHVNSNAGTLGPFSVGIGQALCTQIEPVEEYFDGAPYVQIEYLFEFDFSQDHPHQYWTINKGTMGWATIGSKQMSGKLMRGIIGAGDSFDVATDPGEVLLNLDGTPVQTQGAQTIYVAIRQTNNDVHYLYPCEAPTTAIGQPMEKVKVGDALKLCWRIRPEADFSTLEFSKPVGA